MIQFLTVLMLICFADARVDSQQQRQLVLPQPHQKAEPHPQPSPTTHATPQAHNACPSGCAQEVALKNQVADIKYQIKEERRITQDVLHGRTSSPSNKPTHMTAKAGVGSCEASCHSLEFQKIIISREKEELARAQQQHRDAIEKMKHKAQAAHQPAAPQHTTTPQSANQKIEACPRNCVEAVQALDQVYQLRQQIEQAKHEQNPSYTMRAINKTNVQSSGQHCQADCAQVKGIQRQIEKYKTELAKIKSTPPKSSASSSSHSTAMVVHSGASNKAASSNIQSPVLSAAEISALTHPKEKCVNVGQMLRLIYGVEQKISTLNPKYKPHVAPVNLADYREGSCSAESPTVLELRKIQGTLKLYLKDLESASSHGDTSLTGSQIHKPMALPAPKHKDDASGALVPHTPADKGVCPKDCHEAWYYLQEVYKLRQEIEQTKHNMNPNYTMKQINPPTMQDSGQRCHSDCPQVKGIQRQVEKFKTELAKLKAAPSQSAVHSGALVPHTPADKGVCPKDCHEAWYYLQEVYKLRQEIEQTKHNMNPNYTMKQINPPTMQDSGQRCHSDCPQVKGIQRQVEKFKTELAKLKAAPSQSAVQGQKPTLRTPQQPVAEGACPKNCHEAWYYLHQIHDVRQQIEQLKHKKDPSYQMQKIKEPSIQDSAQHCHANCPQVLGIQRQLKKYEDELAAMHAGNALPAPQQGLKGQCKSGCDNETELRVEVQNLNKELDQLKKKADPNYRVKTYKPISAAKTGVMCPANCGNIKQLEKRKIQLEQAINQMRSGHAQPIITEPDDDEFALQPYTGTDTDDHTGPLTEDVTDEQLPNNKKPVFISRLKGAGSKVYGEVRGLQSKDPVTIDNDWSQVTPPSREGYNPYGTQDDLSYSQGYGYNQYTGNYYPYGSSSITRTESGPVTPYPQSGEVFRSDDGDNASNNQNTAAAALGAFGAVIGGLLAQPQQPAAAAPAQPPAIAPTPAPQQPVQPQSVVPQDDGDLNDLYGGSGDYAPATGAGSSSYGGSSYSSGSSYGSGYGSSSSSYGSGSYSSPSSPRYGSSGSSYGSGYNSDYDY